MEEPAASASQPQRINVTRASALKEYRDTPARLERIHFEGINRTAHDALKKETDHLFKATTVKDLVVMAYQAKTHLVQMGLFKSAEVIIDVDKVDGKAFHYEATFVVSEPRRVAGSIFGNLNHRGEAQSNLAMETPSFKGRGEHVKGEVAMNYNATYSLWNVGLHKPFLGWQRFAGASLNVGRAYSEAPWSKFSLLDNAVAAELYHHPFPRLKHQVRWLGSARFLHSLTDGTAWGVRQHSGYSLKSSLQDVLTYSSQDSAVMPTRGVFARLTSEVAGLGGDVAFLRGDLELGAARRLGPFIVAASLGASGVSARSGPSLHIADRVFLGGPYNLRGFGFNAVGASEDGCALGGDASWTAAAHIYKPLYPARVIFAHAFAVAGNIHTVNNRDSGVDVLNQLAGSPRVSAGLGLVLNVMEKIRLELNYSVPLQFRASDQVQQGPQFGAGVVFV